MINDQLVKTTLLLDGKQPEAVLKELSLKAGILEHDIQDALNAGDTRKLKEMYKDYNAILRQTQQIKTATFDVQKVLNNLNGSSLKDLKKTANQLNRELDGMAAGTKEFTAKSEQLRAVNARYKELQNSVKGVTAQHQTFFQKLGDGFNRYFGLLTAAAAALTGIVMGMRGAVEKANAFAQSLANLSAITGLAGSSLKWLGEQAKLLSTTTTASGIRIVQSAKDILEGYKLMGSARPELLKNKEALSLVTENALVLAAASTMEVAPSVAALAATMNQFNLEADQSARAINAIAAGSLAGSAEVEDLTGSMQNVGTVASDSNMSLEQTVAMLEVLAEKQLKGEMAGTRMRGAILKMKDAGVGYTSGIFNMKDALLQINKALDSKSTALEKDAIKQKIFGLENITAGTIMLKSIDRYEQLTKAVTGTNTAFEQAKVNTETNGAKLEQAKNKAELYAITLGDKLTPAMTYFTSLMGRLIKGLLITIDFYARNAKAINILAVTIASYIVISKVATLIEAARNKQGLIGIAIAKLKVFWDNAMKVSTLLAAAAQALFTGNIMRARAALALMTKSMNINPFVLLATAIIALGYAMYELSKAETHEAKMAKIMLDVHTEVKKGMVDEVLELNKLLIVSKDKNRSLDERQAAIKRLNEISPEYLKGLNLENIATKEGAKLIDAYVASLERKWMLEVLETKIKEEMKKAQDIGGRSITEDVTYFQQFMMMLGQQIGGEYQLKTIVNATADAVKNKTTALTDQKKVVDELKAAYKDQLGNMQTDEIISSGGDVETPDLNDGSGDGKDKKKLAKEKSYLEELRKLRAQFIVDRSTQLSEEYFAEIKRIEELAEKEKWTEIEKGTILKELAEKLMRDLAAVQAEYDANNVDAQQTEIQNELVTQEEITKIREENLKKRFEYAKKKGEETSKLIADAAKREEEAAWQVVDGIGESLSIASQFSAQQSSQDLKDMDKSQKAELALVEGNKAEEDKINKKWDAIRETEQREQFEEQKQLKMAEILINGAIESAKLWASTIYPFGVPASIVMQGMIVARTAANLALVEASEYATGNYPGMVNVKGKQTGTTYNAHFEPSVRSGIYSRPTYLSGLGIVGENNAKELVVSAPDLSNIEMNYPGIKEALYSVVNGGVPQFAKGNYPAASKNGSNNNTMLNMGNMEALLTELIIETKKPGRSIVVLQDIKRKEDLLNEIENTVRR